jgi:putative PEP-CTERM system TPR-repeat lipoprotein
MPRIASKRTLTAAACGVLLLGAGLAGCHRDESTASLLAQAKQYQQKGDQKAALIELKNAVEKSPQDGQARLALGAQYFEMGDVVSADKELHKALSRGAPKASVLPLLARALQAQGQFQKVLDEITPELAKGAPALLVARADALLALGKNDDAKAAYEQALAADPNGGDARVGLARLALMQKDSALAQRYVEEAIAKDPKNPEVFMFKGAMLRAAGKGEEALAAYDQALALKPDHRTAHVEKAYVEIGMGKYDAAKADLAAAAKTSPGSVLVTYTHALLDYSQGKYAEALEALQKVLRVAPDHLPTILLAGATEMNLGATQQAEQHLRKYLESNPDNVFARKLLAQTLLKSAQPDDAVAALAPALKGDSQDAQLLALAGESYMQVKDFKNASSYFEKASALTPKAAVLHTSLGLSQLNQGERDKGMNELELAASLDPKSLNAGIALVQAQLNLKNYDKALAAAQALAKQQPDNPQVHNLEGVVELAKGERAGARAAFAKAVALQPNFFPAITNLARLDMQDHQPEAAKKHFLALLEKDQKNFGAMAGLADIALAQGKPDEATSWLEKASNLNPDAVAPALRLGGLYLHTKQAQKAVTLARKFQTANPTNADLLDLLGQAQLATNDAAGALETYSKLVNVLPKSALAQVRLATADELLKNEDAAADDLKHAVELQPNFVPARVAQVQLAVKRGKSEAALGFARDAQKLDGPARVAGYMLEGDVQLAAKKPELALAPYQKAYELGKSPQLLVKLAEIMKLSGKASAAQPLLAQWRQAHPDEPMVAMYVAEQALAGKQYKSAIPVLEGIVKHNPNNAVALNNLAWAYQQVKDARALPTAEQALKVSVDSPAIMDTLGWLLIEQGNTGRGVPLLQKAATLAPNAPDIHYHLAYGLSKSGDKTGARKELDKLLSQNQPFEQLEAARALLKTL